MDGLNLETTKKILQKNTSEVLNIIGYKDECEF
jgi:hypothetical protein